MTSARPKLLANAEAPSTVKILTVAKLTGMDLEVVPSKTETPCGLPAPELQLPNLTVRHTNAILRRLAQATECGLMGSSFIEEGLVDSWLEWSSLLVDHQVSADPVEPVCEVLEAHLKSRTFLVGQRLTLADISAAVSCRGPLEGKGLDELQKRYPSVIRWLRTCIHHLGLDQTAAPTKPATEANAKVTVDKVEGKQAANAPKQDGKTKAKEVPAPKQEVPAPVDQELAHVEPDEKSSKKDDKKKAKEDAKKAKEEEKKKREMEMRAASEAKSRGPEVTLETLDTHTFGNLFIRSECKTNRTWTLIKELNPERKGQKVWLRARVQSTRKQGGKLCFLELRQNIHTVQAVCFGTELAGFGGGFPDETVADIYGEITCPEVPVQSVSQKDVELQVEKLFCVGRSQPLPLVLADASARESEDKDTISAGQETRLDNRVIDLRTAANQAIFRMQSGVCTLFREFLLEKAFTEIHTPKMIGSSSEGGADVFRVDYFGGNAYLAQSPQLYKQMVLMGDMERVFEIGPVFRSEKSFTHRHMTEFVGLDMEMIFNDHYHEVLDVLDGMFNHIFNGLNTRFKDELEAVRRQYPFEDLKWKYPCLRLTFKEAIELLKADGPKIIEERINAAKTDYQKGVYAKHLEAIMAHDIFDDISTEDERVLGEVMSRKYGEEFYIIDKFPTPVRPFYSMRDPKDERWANAYDFFLRGEEITSGAQRVHDPAMLERNAAEKGITLHQPYVDSFKYGAFPHAGAGVGLERVVMLFCNLNNIRKTSLFPRDPKRLDP